MPEGEYQVETDAQTGAGQRFEQLCLHALLVDHDCGAGDDPFPVRVENAPRDARRSPIVISIDDQFSVHSSLSQVAW